MAFHQCVRYGFRIKRVLQTIYVFYYILSLCSQIRQTQQHNKVATWIGFSISMYDSCCTKWNPFIMQLLYTVQCNPSIPYSLFTRISSKPNLAYEPKSIFLFKQPLYNWTFYHAPRCLSFSIFYSSMYSNLSKQQLKSPLNFLSYSKVSGSERFHCIVLFNIFHPFRTC